MRGASACFSGTGRRPHQRLEPGARVGRKPGLDRRITPLVVGAHGAADDARDAIRGGRLETERAAPGLGLRGELAHVARPGDDGVAQPGAELIRVGDRRFPEAEQGAYLGALSFGRAVGGLGQQRRPGRGCRHAERARELRHRILVHLGRGAGEAAAGAEEQQHDREAQPAAPAPGLDQQPVRRGEVPGGAVERRRAHARPLAGQ
jgi:hypothetical protein